MKLIVVLLLTAGIAPAESRVHKIYNWSRAALIAGAAADTASSFGMIEANPVLGRGRFGARQATIKVGITSGMLVAQYFAVRRHPERERLYVWSNFFAAGVWGGVAAHNYSLRSK